jgi:hypothetical protein
VAFRSAKDTWLRSIIKADCTLNERTPQRKRVDNNSQRQQLSTRGEKKADSGIHFGDRLAGLKAGEDWGTIGIRKIVSLPQSLHPLKRTFIYDSERRGLGGNKTGGITWAGTPTEKQKTSTCTRTNQSKGVLLQNRMFL